jgi:hypothetical protein
LFAGGAIVEARLEILARLGVAWRETDCFFVLVDRVIEAAEVFVCETEIVVELGICRVQRDDFLELACGVGPVAGSREGDG